MDPIPPPTTNDPADVARPADVYDRIAAKAGEIEAEMRRLGYWQPDPLPGGAMRFKEPFAADTMTFRQWLQFVFLPKVRDLVRRRQELPDASTVGSHAVRALEADPKADQLVSLLTEFDALFGTPQFRYGPAGGRGRFRRVVQVAVWTVLMVAAGVLCVGYGSRLAPKDRQVRYSFAVREPASGGYESINLTATAAGSAGRLEPGVLELRLFHDRDTPPAGDMTIDLKSRTYRFAGDKGEDRSGALDVEPVVAWMYLGGASVHPDKLKPEAAALIDLAADMARDPAGTFERVKQGGDAGDPAAGGGGGRPFRLSALGNVERDLTGTLPLWVRVGVPAVVWVAGLGAIALASRRRGATG